MREAQAAEIKREGALLGQAERFPQRAGIAAAAAEGLGRGRKREVAPAFAGIGLTGPGEGADGLNDLISGGFAGMEIADFGKKKRGGGEGIPAPGRAGGERDGDQAGRVIAEKRAGGARFGKDPAKVGIADTVADVEEDRPGEWSGAVWGRDHLSSENGLKTGFPGGEEEVYRTVEVGIGQPDRGNTQLSRPGDDGSDRQERIMKTVMGPNMEGDVGDHELLYKCITNCFWKAQVDLGWGGERVWGESWHGA